MKGFAYDGVVVSFKSNTFKVTDGLRFQNLAVAAEIAARLTISGIGYEFQGDVERGFKILGLTETVTNDKARALLDELSRRPSMRGVL